MVWPINYIELDGDEKLHDEVRGVKGNYKKCLETYDLLKQKIFYVITE